MLPNLLEWQLPKDSRGRVLAAAEKTGVDDEAHNTCRDINADYLRGVYPRFDEFVAVRNRLDPDRVFTNDYLNRVLGH